MRAAARAWLAFPAVLLLACAPEAPVTRGPLPVAEDGRYRITLLPPDWDQPAPGLELRVEPKPGWHIEPEAPARLELEPPPHVEFGNADLRSADAVALGADRLAFATEVRARPGAEGPQLARGRVKFGLCRQDDEGCEIVRREVELPLGVVPASRGEGDVR